VLVEKRVRLPVKSKVRIVALLHQELLHHSSVFFENPQTTSLQVSLVLPPSHRVRIIYRVKLKAATVGQCPASIPNVTQIRTDRHDQSYLYAFISRKERALMVRTGTVGRERNVWEAAGSSVHLFSVKQHMQLVHRC
jgi:hypothetical protein